MEVAVKDAKPQGLRSAAGKPLQIKRCIWLVTQMGQRVHDTGFLIVGKLAAVNILMDTAIVNANVMLISPEKQMAYPVSFSPVAMKGTDHEASSVTQVDGVVDHSIWRRVARTVEVPALSQVPVLVRTPETGLQVVEPHPHLICQRLSMLARGPSNVSMNHAFTLLLANWSKTALSLPKHMLISHCVAVRDVLWPILLHGYSLNNTQLYREAEAKGQKRDRHIVAAKQDANDKEKHRNDPVQLNDKYCHRNLELLKMMEKYHFM